MTTNIARRYDISTMTPTLYTPEQTNMKIKHCRFSDNEYSIIRYNKDTLAREMYNTIGLFRSVIYKDNMLVCYSPPKSIDYVSFKTQVSQIVSIEEYVEGTMINLFWTGTSWEIATRSSVGGNVSFFSDKDGDRGISFRRMFLDTIAVYENNTSSPDNNFFAFFDNMPKTYCFSFVLQHPNNRIVVPFDKPSLYLVKLYDLSEKGVVNDIPIINISNMLPSWVKFPSQLQSTLVELEQSMSSGTVDYTIVGAMIYGVDSITGNIIRTKIRNTSYEVVRQLRGNQPKLKYQYLTLRQEGQVSEYLSYYPEHKEMFSIYREQIHTFTSTLFLSYVSCYIKKLSPLKTYSSNYRTHMFKIHEIYKCQLRELKKFVTKNIVIEYVNKLPPSLLMHSINVCE